MDLQPLPKSITITSISARYESTQLTYLQPRGQFLILVFVAFGHVHCPCDMLLRF